MFCLRILKLMFISTHKLNLKVSMDFFWLINDKEPIFFNLANNSFDNMILALSPFDLLHALPRNSHLSGRTCHFNILYLTK